MAAVLGGSRSGGWMPAVVACAAQRAARLRPARLFLQAAFISTPAPLLWLCLRGPWLCLPPPRHSVSALVCVCVCARARTRLCAPLPCPPTPPRTCSQRRQLCGAAHPRCHPLGPGLGGSGA